MIFKYCSPSAHSLENLRNSRIICRHYSDFNDPFEFWSAVRSGIPDSTQEYERFLAAIGTWGFPEERLDEALEHHQEYFKSLEDGQPDFPLLFDHTRIACFAKSRTSLLMWSHYADGLRGFCLGLDSDALVRGGKDAYLAPVRYVDAPPVVDSFVYAVAEDQYDYHMMALEEPGGGTSSGMEEAYRKAADEAFSLMVSIWENAFAAKPRDWAYEEESRLLLRTSDGGSKPIVLDYPTDALKEVILGERMNEDYREHLIEAVRSVFGDVPIYAAHRARDRYEMSLERVPE